MGWPDSDDAATFEVCFVDGHGTCTKILLPYSPEISYGSDCHSREALQTFGVMEICVYGGEDSPENDKDINHDNNLFVHDALISEAK